MQCKTNMVIEKDVSNRCLVTTRKLQSPVPRVSKARWHGYQEVEIKTDRLFTFHPEQRLLPVAYFFFSLLILNFWKESIFPQIFCISSSQDDSGDFI